jgi:ABC-type transport system involved in Fe-S cluster assembly fused permease/ATPase subunit
MIGDIPCADNIVVLQGGKICEQGTHEDSNQRVETDNVVAGTGTWV